MSEAHATAPQTRHTVRFALLTVAASVVFLTVGGALAWLHNFLHMGQQCSYTNSCRHEMGYIGDILGRVAPVAVLVIIVLTSVRVHRSNGRTWIIWAIGFASPAAAHIASNLISGAAPGCLSPVQFERLHAPAALREIVEHRLNELGHDAGLARDRIADQVMQATTERLVLLVPAEDECVAFEIRSLQELMAARALGSASGDDLRARLIATAPSPHWRNTWVFVAGALFANGPDHRRELLVDIVESVDHRARWAGWLCPIGPALAGALLEDGLAITTPNLHRRLIGVALRAVEGSVPMSLGAVASGREASAAVESSLRMRIRNTLKSALAGTPRAAVAAVFLLSHSKLAGEVPETASRAVEADGRGSQDHVSVHAVLTHQLAMMPDPTTAATALAPVMMEIK